MSDEGEPNVPAAGARVPDRVSTRQKSWAAFLPSQERTRFEWLKLRWQWWVGARRVGMFTHRHAGAIRRTLMVLAGLGLGLLADFFGAGYIPKADLANYLVATGAMIGGTTAIVFSISLFLLQGVSDMYSSRHLEDYVNHWRDQLIFPIIIVIMLLFFATALDVASMPTAMNSNRASLIVAASLLLVGGVFGLIDQQYEAVRRKVSPARVIDFLRSKANGFLRQMERDATQIAAIVRVPSAGMTADEALAIVYNQVLGPLVTDLGVQTERLVALAVRLAERQEVEMARLALVSVGELLAGYLKARRTSSLAFPSPRTMLATESDSQSFLSDRFDQLHRAGMTFVHAGQDDLAAQVVDVYRTAAAAAKNIKSLGLTNENPILESAMWSLNSYMKDALGARNIEVVFQGSEVLMEIGIMAVDTGLDTLVLAVQERLQEFGTVGLGFNSTVVFDRAAGGLLAILAAAFRGKLVNRKFAVERSLQGIEALIAALTAVLGANYIKSDFSTSQAQMTSYTHLQAIIDGIVAGYDELGDDGEKRSYRRDLVRLFNELRRHFRNMTTQVKADSLTAEFIGRLIFDVNATMIALLGREEFGDVAADLRKALGALCHSPYWFLAETASFDADAGAVTALVDAVAKTGILAWRATEHDVVAQCIHAIDAMARAAVDKGSGSGYAQARIMECACYLGILARQSGWSDIVADLKTRLGTFETAFVKKFLENIKGLPADFDPYNHHIGGLPHAYQVANELLRWAGDFDYERLNDPHIMDDAEDMMYELTNEAEIEAFVKEMWGIE